MSCSRLTLWLAVQLSSVNIWHPTLLPVVLCLVLSRKGALESSPNWKQLHDFATVLQMCYFATRPFTLCILWFVMPVTDDCCFPQEPVPDQAAARPDPPRATGSSHLAAAAKPGSPTSTTTTSTSSRSPFPRASLATAPPAAVLPGAGDRRHHAGQHLQLCTAQAVHRCPNIGHVPLRPLLWVIRVQRVLPPLSQHPTQALQQSHPASVY